MQQEKRKAVMAPGKWTAGRDGLVPLDADAKSWTNDQEQDVIESGARLYYELVLEGERENR